MVGRFRRLLAGSRGSVLRVGKLPTKRRLERRRQPWMADPTRWPRSIAVAARKVNRSCTGWRPVPHGRERLTTGLPSRRVYGRAVWAMSPRSHGRGWWAAADMNGWPHRVTPLHRCRGSEGEQILHRLKACATWPRATHNIVPEQAEAARRRSRSALQASTLAGDKIACPTGWCILARRRRISAGLKAGPTRCR